MSSRCCSDAAASIPSSLLAGLVESAADAGALRIEDIVEALLEVFDDGVDVVVLEHLLTAPAEPVHEVPKPRDG